MENGRNLPVYSIGCGSAGILAAISTGIPVLIPLGLIAGFIVDVEKCSKCGSAGSESNPIYRPMTGREKASGNLSFTPRSFDKPAPKGYGHTGNMPQPTSTGNQKTYSNQNNQTSLTDQRDGWANKLRDELVSAAEGESSTITYEWDELNGKLVPTGNSNENSNADIPIPADSESPTPELTQENDAFVGFQDENIFQDPIDRIVEFNYEVDSLIEDPTTDLGVNLE